MPKPRGKTARVSVQKLDDLRTVLARHWIPGLRPNASDRAIIDTALLIATVVLADVETVTALRQVKKTVPAVLPLIPVVRRYDEAPIVEPTLDLEIDGEALYRQLSGLDDGEA